MNIIYFAAFAVFTVVLCEDAEEYNAESFPKEISKRNHFVMFYAPWCHYCQKLAPVWKRLAETVGKNSASVKIAKVDCTADSKLCSDQNVSEYPTLKFFKAGDSAGIKFKGTRDLQSLTAFISEQLGAEGEIYNDVADLTEHKFKKDTETGTCPAVIF